MSLVDVTSPSQFQADISSGSPLVVHFWAAWCEPCKQMDVVLRQLAAENSHAKFLRVEAEEQPEISDQFGVASVPLFLLFKNGKLVDKVEGANAPELAHKVALHISKPQSQPGSSSGVGATVSSAEVINNLQKTLGQTAPPSTSGYTVHNSVTSSVTSAAANGQPAPKGDLTPELTQRLGALLRSQPVLLFMKGSPDEPRCGFSSKVVAALREVGVPFGHFDILGDEEVRQGLKVFSDWPTFPQLYADGELLGGCDIVLEMKRSGELRKVLEKAVTQAQEEENKGEDLEGKLRRLITSSPVMLFMKGSPDAPQCGFSRRVVGALQSEGVEFSTFDILTDESVRQGLKTYSQWPTYPQLYCKGEFIGGCDIVMELKSNGELGTTLKL